MFNLFFLAQIGRLSNQLIFYTFFGRKEFGNLGRFGDFFVNKCNIEFIDNDVCKNLVFEICGPSVSYNVSRTTVYLKHFPSGTSVKNMVHFAQLVISGNINIITFEKCKNLN